MKSNLLLQIATLSLLALTTASAATLPVVSAPKIPERSFEITTYGAASTNGFSSNTKAIQEAINAAAQAGGGTVVIPAGKFICGPIKLQSNIRLYLTKDAHLLMSSNITDFPVVGRNRENFISAADAHDVSIAGEGTIDGQGEPWWKAYRAQQLAERRPQMIVFANCERIEIKGIHTVNPPNTHCSLRNCRDITIEGITMTAPDESPNTDALNLSGAKNVRIANCHISTGDDNIVFLTSGRSADGSPKVENVLVSNCTLGFGHGLSIGSYTSGGLRHLRFENITFDGTTSGIRMKADRGRGGEVEDVVYENISMKNVRYPIYITSYYPRVPTNDVAQPMTLTTPVYRNIRISNLNATGPQSAGFIVGLPECAISNVVFENLLMNTRQGLTVRNAKGVEFRNSAIKVQSGTSLILETNAIVSGLQPN